MAKHAAPKPRSKVKENPVVNAEVVRTVLVTVLGYFGYQLSDDLMAFAVSGGVLAASWVLSIVTRSRVSPLRKLEQDAEYPLGHPEVEQETAALSEDEYPLEPPVEFELSEEQS